jgi:FixJ family two-component response regulator
MTGLDPAILAVDPVAVPTNRGRVLPNPWLQVGGRRSSVALPQYRRILRSPRLGRQFRRRSSWSCITGSEWSCLMKEQQPVVFVVDDDASLRESVEDLLRSVGLEVKSFGSTEEFLRSRRPDAPGCIVLDVRMPGQSGLEFQRTLVNASIHLPIIFISGHGDIPMSVQAMKSGAIGFLTKPLREQDLLDAIQAGIERDCARRQGDKVVAELQERLGSLTVREREVFALVITGRPNKLIAARLELSETTVKLHRSQVTRKMRAKSLIELVRMADKLGISTGKL